MIRAELANKRSRRKKPLFYDYEACQKLCQLSKVNFTTQLTSKVMISRLSVLLFFTLCIIAVHGLEYAGIWERKPSRKDAAEGYLVPRKHFPPPIESDHHTQLPKSVSLTVKKEIVNIAKLSLVDLSLAPQQEGKVQRVLRRIDVIVSTSARKGLIKGGIYAKIAASKIEEINQQVKQLLSTLPERSRSSLKNKIDAIVKRSLAGVDKLCNNRVHKNKNKTIKANDLKKATDLTIELERESNKLNGLLKVKSNVCPVKKAPKIVVFKAVKCQRK